MSTALPVIPVLDLMIGQIVLAEGGKRDLYQPVLSRLTCSSQPLDVAKAIFQQTGCDTLYLADIDSFAGADPNWRVFNQLLDAGFGLWVDASWISRQSGEQIAERIRQRDRLKIIVSSETISTLKQLELFERLLSQTITPIFSLDLQGENIITQSCDLYETRPLDLVKMAYSEGVREFIVLDLAGVGTMRGIPQDSPFVMTLKNIRRQWPDVRLTSGGGIRSAEDAQQLLTLGCNHVLVASAIHQCRFTPDDVAHLIT